MFITQLPLHWRSIKEDILHNCFNLLIKLSLFLAKLFLKKHNIKILIDSCVISHGVTHKNEWVSTKEPKPGDPWDNIKSRYLARVPAYSRYSEIRLYRDVKYLVPIAQLAKLNIVELYTSKELFAERNHQPTGRYQGYSWFKYSLFDIHKIPSIDGHDKIYFNPEEMLNEKTRETLKKGYVSFKDIDPFGMYPDNREKQQLRLQSYAESNDLLNRLTKFLGQKSSQDAYHIYIAEKYGMYCFLTTDYKLVKQFRSMQSSKNALKINTKVMTPSEFAKRFMLVPIPPHWLSCRDKSSCLFAESINNYDRRIRKQYRYRTIIMAIIASCLGFFMGIISAF